MRNHTWRLSVLLALLAGLVLAADCTGQQPAPSGNQPASASPSAALVTPDLIVEKIGCINPRQESSVIGVSVACNIGETYFGIFDFKTETETTIADMITYQGGGYARYDKFLIMTSDAVVGKEAFAKLGVEGKFQEMPEELSAPPSEEGPIETRGRWTAFDEYSEAEFTFAIGEAAKGKAANYLKGMEELRKLAKAKPVFYLLINIDNTNGDDSASVHNATVVNLDGEQIESIDPHTVLDAWHEMAGDDDGVYDLYLDLFDRANRMTYKPKSKGYSLLVFDKELPKEVLAIYLNDNIAAHKVQ